MGLTIQSFIAAEVAKCTRRRQGIVADTVRTDGRSNMSKSADGRTAIDMVLSRDNGDGGGALCNDPSGLNLHSRGNIDASKAGSYTSLARLAAQLDGGGGVEAPVISIETDKASTVVKEFAGHCVVMRVPAPAKAEDGVSVGEADGVSDAQQPQEGGE